MFFCSKYRCLYIQAIIAKDRRFSSLILVYVNVQVLQLSQERLLQEVQGFQTGEVFKNQLSFYQIFKYQFLFLL